MRLNNPTSETYRRRDRHHLWHPYSKHSTIAGDDFPIIVRGQGPYLFDCKGKRYFDAISSWWCCNLGHNHPRLVKAIRTQAGKLQHSILGNMSHPPAIELAERLAGLFKDKNRRVFFSSDGASAVEAAIKIAVQYWHNIGRPKRCRLVSFENAYHGDTLGAVSAGYLPQFHRPFKSLLFPVYRAAAPFCASCAKNPYIMGQSFVGPPLAACRPLSLLQDGHAQAQALQKQPMDGKCDCECFQSMQTVIDKHAEEIAAVIVEPLCQCAAGMRIYPPSYLKKLAQLCHSHKILLIADEIAVGFGRTGTMFAFEQAGIAPDMVCIGKGLAGGYLPISATIVKESIYATFSDSPKDHTFYHGHTFAGNPIACAVALEVLKIYRAERIIEKARRQGALLNKKMAVLREGPGVCNVRGLGMLAAVDLTLKTGWQARVKSVRQALLARGVLIRPLGNTIYLMPPLNTPENLLEETIDLLEKVLSPGRKRY